MNKSTTSAVADTPLPASASSTRSVGRTIGFATMIAICIGVVVVQGSMVSALQGIGFGGAGFLAAAVVAFLLAQCNALSFAELSLMFPRAGGTLSSYTEAALGPFPAIVAVYAGYVVVAMFGLSAELMLVDAVIGQLFPGMVPEMVVPLGILGVLAVLNILGTDVFARMQNVFTFAMVSALLLVGLTAVSGSANPAPVELTGAIEWNWDGILDGGFLGLVALAMWLLVGVEFICPLIQDVRNPERNVPRAMMLSLCLIFAIFFLFCLGASLYLPLETLTTSPLPYLDYVEAVFGKAGLIVATVMAVTATCSTVNTVLAAVPRMLHGMAVNGQSFPQLKRLHPRFNTPWVAILFMAGIIALPFLLLGIDSIITLLIAASTSWLLAYIIAHLDVIVLRRSQPQLARPFRTPFYPLPQLVGILGMGYVALNNSPSPEMTQTVYTLTGVVLLIIGVIAALWVKLVMKRGLFQAEMPKG
ncbi:Amino acid transporter [Geopseudomonas sagittaria]|uniref:Amino acid transporter n=1 Tax=Geopseudomonas sagittaria TaxID=1135990 RepID=A0A1I5SSG4_9GAMM|nr:APC family permease [Pseudomonas sagittaria]SFP73581.1 Amino acid transporter [Pseudomonas sagittaria]